MKIPIAAIIESRVMRIPNMKFSTPNAISPAIPTTRPPMQRAMFSTVFNIKDNVSHKAFLILPDVVFISIAFLSSWFMRIWELREFGFPFSFRLLSVRRFYMTFGRIGHFRFRGLQKVGIRGCKVFRTKYYLSLWGWRFFRKPQGLTLHPRWIP